MIDSVLTEERLIEFAEAQIGPLQEKTGVAAIDAIRRELHYLRQEVKRLQGLLDCAVRQITRRQ